MKITAALQKNGKLAFHFGNADYYGIYDVVDGEVVLVNKIEHVLSRHFEVYDDLAREGITLAFSGAIGETQLEHLDGRDIKVVYGLSGDPVKHIYAFLDGEITVSKEEDEPVAACSLSGALDLSDKE